jgi:hypothetical protein
MDFDTVLSSVFKIYTKKFFPLFISSFFGVFIIQIIMYQLGFFELYQVDNPEDMMLVFSKLMGKISILSISYVVIYGVLNAFLVNYILHSDQDSLINFGDLLAVTIRKYSVHMIFFLILSILIVLLGMIVGVLAFVVGMLFAAIYLGAVLIPGGTILVAEDKNAIDTVGRTFSLMHKDFWTNLGIFVVFILIMILLSFVVNALISIPFVIMFFDNLKETGSLFEALNFRSYDLGIWLVVINSVAAAMVYPIYSVLSVVMYFKMKYVEDQKEMNQMQ